MRLVVARAMFVVAVLAPFPVHGQGGPVVPEEVVRESAEVAASAEGERMPEPFISGDAWVGLLGALVGAAIGFGAAVFGVWLANREARRQHEQAVRVARDTIVGEVGVNQENFRADWRLVSELQQPADVAPVNRAGMYPAPTVITTAWESQIGLVPEAFAPEEALDLHRFYASAHSAVAIRQAIQQLYVNDAPQQSRNEAFDVYRNHAERVMRYVVPQAPARANYE